VCVRFIPISLFFKIKIVFEFNFEESLKLFCEDRFTFYCNPYIVLEVDG
jgi:hypothetical protein